ncbi:MAG: serine protease, partial [Pseudomonadota bacterium]
MKAGKFLAKLFKTNVAAIAIVAVVGVTAPVAVTPASAQGPASVADLAEGLMSAVVNISTSQNVPQRRGGNNIVPRAPEGSPFQDFFDELFPRGENNENGNNNNRAPRTRNSLGSGFVLNA